MESFNHARRANRFQRHELTFAFLQEGTMTVVNLTKACIRGQTVISTRFTSVSVANCSFCQNQQFATHRHTTTIVSGRAARVGYRSRRALADRYGTALPIRSPPHHARASLPAIASN